MKTTTILERDVLAGVLDACRVLGISVQRQNTGMATNPKGKKVRFGVAGNADISGTLPDGRRLEIEVKRPGKRPTDEQYHRMNEVNATNGVAFWTDDAERCLNALRRIVQDGWRVEIEDDGTPVVTDE